MFVDERKTNDQRQRNRSFTSDEQEEDRAEGERTNDDRTHSTVSSSATTSALRMRITRRTHPQRSSFGDSQSCNVISIEPHHLDEFIFTDFCVRNYDKSITKTGGNMSTDKKHFGNVLECL